jgi:hypothetical protein
MMFCRHGFLPLQGLEVPLMVLQSKVFLICTLRRYSPQVQKKKTLLRRVKKAVSRHHIFPTNHHSNDHLSDLENGAESDDDDPFRSESFKSVKQVKELSQQGAMELFTKVPFPEPRRVVYLKHRQTE